MRLSLSVALIAALAVSSHAADADPVGLTDLAVSAPHRARDLDAVVWYPASSGAPVAIWGENPVFEGDPVSRDAPVAGRGRPVVLLSHGLGGNLRGMGWLAHGLAERGAVVVAVNHPGSTTGDLDPARSLDHGSRARDLTAALDALADDDRFGGHVDTGAVTAAGFSLGGWTALSLGGLRGSIKGYAAHCAEVGRASTHCSDIADWGIDLTSLDVVAWDAPYADPRVAHVAAIDPGLIWGLEAADADAVTADVLLIGLGAGEDRLLATDFDRSGLADLLPKARRAIAAPARHWSMLPVCKPGSAEIVAGETDYPICTDPPEANRAALHARIVELVAQVALDRTPGG